MHITERTHRGATLRRSLVTLTCAGALAVAGTLAAFADGTEVIGNQNCAQLSPGALELRVNAPADGTFSNTDGFSVTIDVRTLAADDPAHPKNQTGSQVFDFTASGGSVTSVVVKGGPNANLYEYDPAVNSGTALHSPVNPSNNKFFGLSHISFCYVPKATPTLVTQVSPTSATIGASFKDTATLSGGNNPGGTITFKVYGPDDATCTGPVVHESSTIVTGNGSYDSGLFTPTTVGTYRWIASYTGDEDNEPVSGACNDANEDATVTQAEPSISTQVSASQVTIGSSFTDTATLSGGHNPTGTITFKVYGPDDATCTGAATTVSVEAVDGNGDYTSDPFTPTVVGTYRWIASYSGDANNKAVSGACNDANEDTTVNKADPAMLLTNLVTPQAEAAVTLLVKNGAIFGDGDESATDSDDVTITLFDGADCVAANAKHSEGFQIDGDAAMPQSFTTSNSTFHVQLSGTEVTWSWQATYEGDAVNSSLTTECQNVAVAFSSTP